MKHRSSESSSAGMSREQAAPAAAVVTEERLPSGADGSGRRWVALFTLAVIMLLGLGLRTLSLHRHHLPAGDGAATAMETAVQLMEGRGYTTNRKWLFFQEDDLFPLLEGNRQPLLSMLLSRLFRITGPSHRAAQWFVLAVSLACIPLTYQLGVRIFDRRTGLLAALFTAAAPIQVWFGSMVEDQTLFQFWFLVLLLLWYSHRALDVLYADRSAEPLSDEPAPGERRSRGKAGASPTTAPRRTTEQRRGGLAVAFIAALPLIMGLAGGFAWLTRPNGLILSAALIIGLFSVSRVPVRVRLRWIALAVLGFLIVALPWMIRNGHLFGDPFHTQNSYFLFLDDPDRVTALMEHPTTAADYVRDHGFSGVVRRWVRGALRCTDAFVSGNLHRNEAVRNGSMALFLLLSLFALRGRLKAGCCGWHCHALPLIAFLLHFIALSWYVRGETRYFLPFFLLLTVAGARGLIVVSGQGGKTTVHGWRPGILFPLLLILLLFSFIRPLFETLSFDDREDHRSAVAAIHWLETESGPETVIMDLPAVGNLIYRYQRPTVVYPWGSLEEIFETARRFNVEYCVLSARTLEWRPALGDHWTASGGRLFEKGPPPGYLEPVWKDRGDRIAIYRLLPPLSAPGLPRE